MQAERIADFAREMAGGGIPDKVRSAACLHLLDAVGVGIAAGTLPGPGRWAEAAGPGSAPLLCGGTADAASAAMVNGALIHALEYDDTHIGSIVHGSAVAAPVALALMNGGPGRTVLAAYATVWEVAIALGQAAPGGFQARGVQATSAAGAIGAAAAAGAAVGLGRREIVSAIGIAAGQAAGTLGFLSEGASCKALNPGWAARTGIEAARLAAAGMTGPALALEGRFGLFDVCAGTPGAEIGALADPWGLPDAAFKLWPCCHYIHPFLEAAEDLVGGGLRPDDVISATLSGPPPIAPLVAEPWERRQAPASGYDAKWGLPYCVALALLDGEIGIESFETVHPDAAKLAQRMTWRAMDGHGFPARFAGRIEVQTARGSRIAERDQALGAPDRPVPVATIRGKFRANAGRRLAPDRVAALEAAVDGLPDTDTSALAAALA